MSEQSDPDFDPGWEPVLSKLFLGLIPGMVLSKRFRRTDIDGITMLRMTFSGFFLAPFLFALVLAFITAPTSDRIVPQAVRVVAIVAAALGVILPLIIRRRSLDASSPAALAAKYRSRMFIGLGVSEWPALLGLALAVYYGRFWLYPLAAIGTVIGFLLVAPTRGALDRQQAAITSSGSPLMLRQALLAHPGNRGPAARWMGPTRPDR